MGDDSYKALFDISEQTFLPAWPPVLLGLFFSLFGAVAVFANKAAAAKVFGLCMMTAGLTWSGAFFLGARQEFNSLQSKFHQGDYASAVGLVQNFEPPTQGGHGPQTFEVGGQSFAIWDSTGTFAFHETVISGGPNLSGKCAKVLYSVDATTDEKKILWLGEKEDGCEDAVTRAAEEKSAPGNE